MILRSPAILLSAAFVLYGCGDPNAPEAPATAQVRQRVVGGQPSDPSNDAVVVFTSHQACTATIVAPRMILTARHCVGPYTEGSFTCTVDGNISPSRPRIPENAGAVGAPYDPGIIYIKVGVSPWDDEPAAYGEQVYVVPTDSICKNDVALVRLDREVAPEPRAMRLKTPTYPGDRVTVIGYGLRDIDFDGRLERSGVEILNVGQSLLYPEGSGAYDRTFSVGQSVCPGDSGGPALDDETGAIVGVFSNITGDCKSTSVRNYYTQLAPYRDFIEESFADSGFEVVYESEPDPGAGGAAGEGGMGNSLSGGSDADGSGGSGPSTSSAGGSGAGGSSTGGSGAGGSSANGGSAGEDLVEDTRPPEKNCNCRVVGGGQESPAGLFSLFGLVGLVGLRQVRRRRTAR